MAVAVVLSEAGNQVEEMRGGAAMTVTPLIPFRIAQTWQLKKRAIWNPPLVHCWTPDEKNLLVDAFREQQFGKFSSTSEDCPQCHETRNKKNSVAKVDLQR